MTIREVDVSQPQSVVLAPIPAEAKPRQRSTRLVEVDSLRGIAAVAVVLFHFTTRFDQLYHHDAQPWMSFSLGHLGVNLFFIISGFVIFMTIEKVNRPMDFVVTRFSRLYPAYWAAVALTFSITHLLGLPERTVDLFSALANLTMVHSLFFGIPHVDGVYWTLQIELLFYLGMFLLLITHRLERIHLALFGLLGLRLIYLIAEQGMGISLPWILYKFLILGQIPWFAIGITVFRLAFHRDSHTRRDGAVLVAALALLLAGDGPGIALLATAFAGLVYGAATGRIGLLRNPILVWLGAISYTLYLVHEYIGWSVMLTLRAAGWKTDATILAAIAVSLILASLITYTVERPAMNRIRAWYRQKTASAAG